MFFVSRYSAGQSSPVKKCASNPTLVVNSRRVSCLRLAIYDVKMDTRTSLVSFFFSFSSIFFVTCSTRAFSGATTSTATATSALVGTGRTLATLLLNPASLVETLHRSLHQGFEAFKLVRVVVIILLFWPCDRSRRRAPKAADHVHRRR